MAEGEIRDVRGTCSPQPVNELLVSLRKLRFPIQMACNSSGELTSAFYPTCATDSGISMTSYMVVMKPGPYSSPTFESGESCIFRVVICRIRPAGINEISEGELYRKRPDKTSRIALCTAFGPG